MKKTLVLLSAFCLISTAYAQTKKIAHRSHSGRDQDFRVDRDEDNLGLPPGGKNPKFFTDSIALAEPKKDTTNRDTLPKPSPKPKPKGKEAVRPQKPKAKTPQQKTGNQR